MRTGGTLYQILQVDPAAEPEIIEAAYRRLAKMYHPDVSRSADASARMKQINAAFEVLRDPGRRATYDRQLQNHSQAASSVVPVADEEDEDWEEADEQEWIACRIHPSTPAVGCCEECGTTLCKYCFPRFQPPSCPACVLAWAMRRRAQLLLPAIWFFAVLGVLGGGFLLYLAGHTSVANFHIFLIELGCTYVLASFPTGWWIIGHEGAEWETLLFASLLGVVAAPFRIGWVVIKLREVGRLRQAAMSG